MFAVLTDARAAKHPAACVCRPGAPLRSQACRASRADGTVHDCEFAVREFARRLVARTLCVLEYGGGFEVRRHLPTADTARAGGDGAKLR